MAHGMEQDPTQKAATTNGAKARLTDLRPAQHNLAGVLDGQNVAARVAVLSAAAALKAATATAGLRKNRPKPISPRRWPPDNSRIQEPGWATSAA